MDSIVIYAFLCVMLVCAVLSVMLKSVIKNAVCLAAASAALSAVMYLFGAHWAAVFELSVCSGLITVIFISSISLSKGDKADVRREFDDKKRMGALPVILIVAGAALIGAGAALHFGIAPAQKAYADFREVFWGQRSADIWGQIIVMLTGGTAVTVLLKEEKSR